MQLRGFQLKRLWVIPIAIIITPDYPPVFLTVGDADPLEPQSLEIIQALKDNGVERKSVLFTGTDAHLGHDYMMDLDSGLAQRTLEKALDFLNRHSRPGGG